ncbi:hypothetical protein J4E86_011806 [Alternaria arbusti]|uniref:uncharacterized protein n=1 Tax=Alternaria arbusti TaxID=232088 RepID=UPI002220977F|nr:uncharacterized protein J4E86_011806 [Alternaria arbusti]KAI4925704.1 hypothetical protein J4E86_011806 [Alternaria arbusti]
MSDSTPLPSDDQIKAFFADDSSFGRFVEFMEVYLYSRRITVSACKAAITAAGFVNPSEFPSPASVFFADESVEEHRTDPVRNDVHMQLIDSSHPGPTTFRWLLTQHNPTQSTRLNLHALTSVLATLPSFSR